MVAVTHLSGIAGVPARRCLRWPCRCCPRTSKSQRRASTEWDCTAPSRRTGACGRRVCALCWLPPPGIWSSQELSRNTESIIRKEKKRFLNCPATVEYDGEKPPKYNKYCVCTYSNSRVDKNLSVHDNYIISGHIQRLQVKMFKLKGSLYTQQS